MDSLFTVGITLQSGAVINLVELQQQYPGQCCLPRSVLNDQTPVVRMDGSNGNFFIASDEGCNNPVTNDVYPAMFESIHVCDACPPGGCYSAPTYQFNGGEDREASSVWSLLLFPCCCQGATAVAIYKLLPPLQTAIYHCRNRHCLCI